MTGGGHGFYRYDTLWENMCHKYGWSCEDGAGDHWDALSAHERDALMDAFAADVRSGAYEFEY